MTTTVLAFLGILLLAAVAAGIAACHRELRLLRRGIAALDEGEGRRAAAIVVGLQGLREPMEAIRTSVEELSPNRRQTMEHKAPLPVTMGGVPPNPPARPVSSKPKESAGLRLDIPRASDEERESDGETRLIPQPIAAELLGSTAAKTPESGRAPRMSRRTVCRLCEGGGVVRARSGAVDRCGGCNGIGFIDPADERATHAGSADERAARLPG